MGSNLDHNMIFFFFFFCPRLDNLLYVLALNFYPMKSCLIYKVLKVSVPYFVK